MRRVREHQRRVWREEGLDKDFEVTIAEMLPREIRLALLRMRQSAFPSYRDDLVALVMVADRALGRWRRESATY